MLQSKNLFSREMKHEDLEAIQLALENQRELLGPCIRFESKNESSFILHYGNTVVLASYHLDSQSKVERLEFHPPVFLGDNWKKLEKYFKENLPKNSSLTVTEENRKIFSIGSGTPLLISRNAQIFVYSLLQEKLASGKLQKTDLVTLAELPAKTPYSILQTWPKDTVLTIDSLFSFAFLESDSLALDILAEKIGAKELSNLTNSNGAFLKFTEYDQSLENALESQNNHQSKSWKSNTESLCAHLFSLRNLPLMQFHIRNQLTQDQVNQGWEKQILFNSREEGISQTSFLLFHQKKKKWFCLSLSANSPASISELHFMLALQRTINLSLETP